MFLVEPGFWGGKQRSLLCSPVLSGFERGGHPSPVCCSLFGLLNLDFPCFFACVQDLLLKFLLLINVASDVVQIVFVHTIQESLAVQELMVRLRC